MATEDENEVAGSGGKRSTSASDPPRKTRGRGLRTRSGCLTCRKRHMKCDEAKPACGQCTRTQKSCLYANASSELPPTRTSQSYSRAFSPETTSLNDLVGASTESTAVSDQHHPRSQTGQVAEVETGPTVPLEASPSATRDVEMTASTFNYTSPASVETNSAYQPISIATARWFGMLAGDAELDIGPSPQQDADLSDLYRTKSPYELRGINSSLIEQPETPLRPADEYATSDPPQERYRASREDRVLIEKLSWQTQTTLSLQGQEHRLFHTFVEHISLWLDLFDPQQNFASLVPRLALYNVGLLNAILTLSIRYYSLRAQTGDDLSLAREDALPYYHETLHYVRKAMQYESYHTSDELLATTIIISTYEMLDGSSRDWERHLQGVFWIQRSQVIHGDSGGLRAAIWWIWLCQDVWAAFRDRRKVFTFWKPQRSLSELGPSELAARSVFILGRVMNYCALENVGNSVNDISEKIRQADILSSLLDEWERLLTPHFTPLPHQDHAPNSVFAPIWVYPPMYGVSLQVYHAARILIQLHKPSLGGFHESIRRQSAIDHHVGRIAGIAYSLSDYASSILSSQCLYIAGLSTFDQRHRDEILRLIAVCRSITGWPATPMDEELKFHWDQYKGV